MARNRMIKPDFWDDEKLSKISFSARLTYIGLWNFSDDYGVVKGNIVWLKNRIFPYDQKLTHKAFKEWLTELCQLKRLFPFEHNGEKFFYMPKFNEHQKINRPSKQARNPKPPQDILNECDMSMHDALIDEKKLREKKRKEVKEKRATTFPQNFSLSDDLKKYAIEKGIDPKFIDDNSFYEHFKDACLSKGRTYKDWDAAFRNFVRNSPKFSPEFMNKESEVDQWKKRILENT